MTTLQMFLLMTLPVTGMCYAFLGAVKLPLAERLGMNEARVGGLLAAFGFMVGPIILFSGFLADALGRSGVILAGGILVSLSLFLLATSRTYRVSMLAVGLFSAGWAAMINVANTLMYMAYSNVFMATNLLDFLFGLGAFLTPTAIVLLVRKCSFPKAVALLALLPLVPAVMSQFILMDAGAAAPAGFGDLIRDPVMWILAFTLMLWVPTETCTAAWATTFVDNLAPAGEDPVRSKKIAAWTLSGFWLCFMGSRLLTAAIFHAVSESVRTAKIVHIVLAAACFVLLVGLIRSRRRSLTVGLLLLAGFLFGPFFPNVMGILLSHFSPTVHGRAVGLLFAGASVGWTLFPALIGWRANRSNLQGGFQIALLTNAALLALVILHFVRG